MPGAARTHSPRDPQRVRDPYTDVVLQAGPAARLDRVDQRGEWTFRVVCYAITMRDGTAFLMFDGAPETYSGHELEISQIAAFLVNA